MPATRPGASAGALRLNLQPKWPFWIDTPKRARAIVEVTPPATTTTHRLSSMGVG